MAKIMTMLTLLMMQAMGGFPPPEITWWIGTRRLQPEQTVGLARMYQVLSIDSTKY